MYHTDAPPRLSWMVGSPGSTVAPTLVPATDPEVPLITCALAKLSLAGGGPDGRVRGDRAGGLRRLAGAAVGVGRGHREGVGGAVGQAGDQDRAGRPGRGDAAGAGGHGVGGDRRCRRRSRAAGRTRRPPGPASRRREPAAGSAFRPASGSPRWTGPRPGRCPRVGGVDGEGVAGPDGQAGDLDAGGAGSGGGGDAAGAGDRGVVEDRPPPSLAGGVKVTFTVPVVAPTGVALVAVTLVGAPGTVAGKTTVGLDSGPLPAGLVA